MGITIPSNPYWAQLDFAAVFDLVTGKITVSLTGSSFTPGAGVNATVQVRFPNGVSPLFTLTAVTDDAVIDLPKLPNGIYWWGNYVITVTAVYPGGSVPLQKTYPLTAPDCVGESNQVQGTLQVSVECQDGTLTGRGFSGYAYQGAMPSDEAYDITRYFPPEAEKLPQKGISQVPFVVQAWEGLNSFKGTNTATYELENGFTVTLQIVAEAVKNVHCAINYGKLWQSVQETLKQLRSCPAADPQLQNLGEVNALLWIITAGEMEGKDVGDEVERLEHILGVDCNCRALAGTQVIVPVGAGCQCPSVTSLSAVFNPLTGEVDVAFNSSGVSSLYYFRLGFRNMCVLDAETVLPVADQPITGGLQTISVPVPIEAMYEVTVSVVRDDRVTCAPSITTTNNPAACNLVIDFDNTLVIDADDTAIKYQ
jgi:hypothetical protein